MEQPVAAADSSDAFTAPPPSAQQPGAPAADPSDAFAQETTTQVQHKPVIDALAAMHETDNSFLHRVAEGVQSAAVGPLSVAPAVSGGLAYGGVRLARGVRELADTVTPLVAHFMSPGAGIIAKRAGDADIKQLQSNQEADDTRFIGSQANQNSPTTGFLASEAPDFAAATAAGMGAEEALGKIIPAAAGKLLGAVRWATIKGASGAAAVQPLYEGQGQSRAETSALGAAGSTVMSGMASTLTGLASGPAGKIAAGVSPTIRDWLVGRQLLTLSRGLPTLKDEPAMAGVTANLGQATGNPFLMEAAKLQMAKPEAQGAMLRVAASNNEVLLNQLNSLGDAMVKNTGENLVQKTNALHDTLTAIHDQMYNEQSNGWSQLGKDHDISFTNKPLIAGLNAYLDGMLPEDKAAFAGDINHIRALTESNQGAARSMASTAALRSNLMDSGRANSETNPRLGRAYNEASAIVNDYMHDPSHIVDGDNIPVTPQKAQDFIADYDGVRNESKKYFDMWSDSGLGDLTRGRKSGEFRRGTDSAVTALLDNPKSPATVDLALSALSRSPNGIPQARNYAVAQFLDRASKISQTTNGFPTIDPTHAYNYLDNNMTTLQKIFPDNVKTIEGMRDTFAMLSRKSNLSSAAIRQLQDEMGNTGFGAMMARVMFANKYAMRNAAGELIGSIPVTRYQEVLSDALLDSRTGNALMQKVTKGNMQKILQTLGKYTSGAFNYGVAAPTANASLQALAPPQPQMMTGDMGQINDGGQH